MYTDSGYDSGVEILTIPHRDVHGDTFAILHELLQQEKQEKADIQQQMAEARTECSAALQKASEAEESRRASKEFLKTLRKEHKNECSKY